jgi:hypothetical protein
LSDFVERFVATALGGMVAAVFAAGLGIWIARRFTARHEERSAQRQRAEAAAEDFYSAYGSFFAAWKSWNDYRGLSIEKERPDMVTPEDRRTFLARASDAEGKFETFLIWLTVERQLSPTDLDRLWCFRRGYKQLRFRVRDDRRLGWTRREEGDPGKQYDAFKGLTVSVAAMIARPAAAQSSRPKGPWSRGSADHREAHDARNNLRFVTGPSEAIRMDYRDSLPAALAEKGRGNELWYVLPELIDKRDKAAMERDGASAPTDTPGAPATGTVRTGS